MLSIIDCYTDEPSGLGVPPYLGTYPRYVAGAAIAHKEGVQYLSIDALREGAKINGDLAVVIAGSHTPGKYLGRVPGTVPEALGFLKGFPGVKFLGGPAALGTSIEGGRYSDVVEAGEEFDYIVTGDIEQAVHDYLTRGEVKEDKRRDVFALRKWAIMGSEIAKFHPDYPYSVAEIELYRGCTRKSYCSFCMESRYGEEHHRLIGDVVDEVKALYDSGIRHFRLGKQPCFYSYKMKNGKLNPLAISGLLRKIREVAPDLRTLHIDNANPAVIANQRRKADEITRYIVEYCTPGNTVAFGMESADPKVVAENNLNATKEQVWEAIKMVNKRGRERGENGMPKFLPGLNFLAGLKGETKNTFDMNLQFLRSVLNQNLLLRRVNIRQVVVFRGTPLFEFGAKNVKKNHRHFEHFKFKARELDTEFLKKMLPVGTVLKKVRIEQRGMSLSFGRQPGSYPLLVGIPEDIPNNTFMDVAVVGYGQRSITGVPYPLDVDVCTRKCLEAIPGVGKRRAQEIIRKRPVKFEYLEEETLEVLKPFL